jgi:hypothetical protein
MVKIILAFWLIQLHPITSNDEMKDHLVGVWQADNKNIADAYADTYQFYQNGHFIFNFDQNINSGRRLLKLNGRYMIKNDTIGFTVDSTVELSRGTVERTLHMNPYSDEWSIVGGVIKTLPQKKTRWEYVAIKFNNTSNNKATSISIDNRVYYKMKNNPSDYR